jgi:hypothetical protein
LGRRGLVVFALAASAVPAATWWACSSGEAASPAKDGGADAAGSGGLAGGGGTGGTTPSGGTGGSAYDGGEWGATPNWEGVPGTAVGCTFERMTNASSVRFLKWEPCPWTQGCEQAVFSESLFGQNATFIRSSVVVDDGTAVRAGLTMWSPRNIATFVGDDGMGLDAFRVTGGKPDCRLEAMSVFGKRLAVEVSSPKVDAFGGILADIGAMTSPPATFDIASPPAGGPQFCLLGDSRWLWWWTPTDRFSTVSASDGSEFQIFATALDPIMGYSVPATTGSLFLAQEYELMGGGHVQGKIAYSDGVSPMKPYLVPPNPNDDYGYPAFASTHVGFMKGISQKDINLFESVELWATPYSEDPTALKPELLAPLPFTSMSNLAGGWGRLGTLAQMPDKSTGAAIWSISTKSVRTYPVPDDHTSWVLMGVTRTHFWIGAQKPGLGGDPYLMRFAVE